MDRRRKFWGWGYEDQQPAASEVEAAAAGRARAPRLRARRGRAARSRSRTSSCRLRGSSRPARSRTSARPTATSALAHTYGKAYRDVVRGFRGPLRQPARRGRAARATRPTSSAVLDWCEEAGAAAIPFGGGTSVVGGVEPPPGPRRRVSIDLGALDRVLEVDAVSRAARIQAGAPGPALEDQLREHGLTLRHFPQSFEFSTLGGWIATRAGGHFATLYTHIDDLVESVRVVTPAGLVGEPPAARLGRRAEPRPDAARLRGHPRRDHRGVDAGAGRPRFKRVGRRDLRLVRGRRARPCAPCRSPASTRRTAGCSTADEAALTGRRRRTASGAPAGPRLRVGRPPARRPG